MVPNSASVQQLPLLPEAITISLLAGPLHVFLLALVVTVGYCMGFRGQEGIASIAHPRRGG